MNGRRLLHAEEHRRPHARRFGRADVERVAQRELNLPFVGANGSISPSGAVAVVEGVSQAFTITPNTGYHVTSVLVDGANVGAVTTWTFERITFDVVSVC